MLTLNDGRSELWQWDTGRTLTVDAECSQVHFSNKVFGRSVDVDVVDGVAIIPDILLQTDKDLNVWAFVGTAENGFTKISKTFKVNSRNKPADYIFTPIEQTTIKEIEKRVEYLEKNPVEAPVMSVNGQTGEINLIAKDVGAVTEEKFAEELAHSGERLTFVEEAIADLKYVPIDITQITDNVVTMEMGSVVNEVTVSWTLNKEPASQTLDGVAVDLFARSKTIPGPFSANKTFTLTVTDERGATDSASTAISFLNGVYYGVMENGAEVDSSAILKLTKKLQGSKGITFTANAGATQRIVYALPARYGTPNFNVGGFDGGFSLVKTFNFTNASGYTESYDVWLSSNVGLGSTTVNVT